MYPTIKISVIIPAYNAASTIGTTLQSLLAQSYQEWEAIVVDDGSMDNTLAAAQGYADADPRIRVIHQTNQGVSAARNKGISVAKNEWLLFLDTEDYIADDYFGKMTETLASDSSLDAVVCGWSSVYPNGDFETGDFPPFLPDLFPVLATRCAFVIHACVFRKSIVAKVGGFNEKMLVCEDWDFWQRVARSGACFGFVKEVLAFYQMTEGSLSRNCTNYFSSALQVLRQGYMRDERVNVPGTRYELGLQTEDLTQKEFYWASWCAGLFITQNKNANSLFDAIKGKCQSRLDPVIIADNLIDSVCRTNCEKPSGFNHLWLKHEADYLTFLSLLEERSKTTGLKRETIQNLARRSLAFTHPSQSYSFHHVHITGIEILNSITDLTLPARTEQIVCVIFYREENLGHIELPVIDGTVSAYTLTDAIADRLSWPILGRFFRQTASTELMELAKESTDNLTVDFNELHDRFGWQLFLDQLWEEKKSRPYSSGREKKTSLQNLKELTIELGEDLPSIRTTGTALLVTLTAGGTPFGRLQVKPTGNILEPTYLRKTIEAIYGFELCKVCVREAVIGQPLDRPYKIKERLHTKARASVQEMSFLKRLKLLFNNKNHSDQTVFTLERRKGWPGSSVSRRADLPTVSIPLLKKMTSVAEENITIPDKNATRAIYSPESLARLPYPDNLELTDDKLIRPQQQYDRHHFETLFSKSADPWKYTDPYEQTKYEQTLSLLPLQVNNCLELACAEGHFTIQLAPHVKHLIAADISKVALERAAERCQACPNIVYQQLDISKDVISGSYDLIVCSEVLYYMGGIDDLKNVAQKMSKALAPQGYILMAHAHQIIDDPENPGFDWGLAYGAKVIGDVFSSLPELKLRREIRTPLYRIQLFQQESAESSSAGPTIVHLEQPTPIPFRVEKSVRWQGGQPTTWSEKVETRRLPILMYHSVSPDHDNRLSRYRISPEQLEEQLCYLRDSGYYGIGIDEWVNAILKRCALPGRAVALSFDDGYKDFYEFAWPLLERYGFTATVFLVSDYLGKTNEWDKPFSKELPLMSREEICFLQGKGVAFGSHSATHSALGSLSPEQVVEEAVRSRTTIQGLLGTPVQSIAYPYGSTSGAVANLCGGVGYIAGLSCQSGLSTLYDNPLHLPRIEIMGSDRLKDFVAKLTV